jgi:hypothetical protein
MKAVLIALSLVMVSAEAAQAISRSNSTSMSCERIRATVRAEGAVILRWRGKSGVLRYGRFVAHGGFCESGTRAETSYVPARDRGSCPVYECKYWDPEDDFIWRPGFRRF